MNEADFHREIEKMFNVLNGAWPYHPPDESPFVTDDQIWKIIKAFSLKREDYKKLREILPLPKFQRKDIVISKPDVFGNHPTDRCVVAECKLIAPKVEIEPYLDPAQISEGQRTWLDTWKYQSSGMCFLGLCTTEAPRRAWLIPWDIYVELERKLAHEDLFFKIRISQLPSEYELIWNKSEAKTRWNYPEGHPLQYWGDPATSPSLVDWDKKYSLRFSVKKGE
jgi:hypothetical protein